MRMKRFYMPTLREVPADAEIASHRLLLRAGMIRMTASGIYSYLPLGERVLQKVERVVREEMDRAGAQEIRTSILQPREIWEASGRWRTFGPEMFKLKDRNEREYSLGPTAEESFTDLVKEEIRSYKQLPLNLYQIQWKYRDEKRPRFGINRSREFLMKDAYTFDVDRESMEAAYQNMWDAYVRVFDRLGLDYRVVLGDSGAMGGNLSHEFTALSEVGEGVIVYCPDCDYAATDEKAGMAGEEAPTEEAGQVEKISTPHVTTIEDLVDFLSVDAAKMVKAICLKAGGDPVMVFLPAERELNMAKLVAYLQVPEHEVEMMDDETIEKLTGAQAGFTGPIGLDESVRVLVDRTVTQRPNLICGANETGFHLKNVNFGRDFDGEVVDDLRMVKEGDRCPKCGAPLHFARGIEVGNIFQLGTKYSESMGASFLDENGKSQPIIMGSYGIGVTRSISAIVEQNHDDKGIIWPLLTAPYQVIISIMNMKDQAQVDLAEKIYADLMDKGVEVLLDDRDERAGVKFNDRDLIGIPLRLTVGKKAGEDLVEYSTRKELVNEDMTSGQAMDRVLDLCGDLWEKSARGDLSDESK